MPVIVNGASRYMGHATGLPFPKSSRLDEHSTLTSVDDLVAGVGATLLEDRTPSLVVNGSAHLLPNKLRVSVGDSSPGESHKADSTSDLCTKPPSLDGKSITSGTTFALDEKESLRPDDSASVKAAAVDDDDAFSIRGSLLASSRIGSDIAVRRIQAEENVDRRIAQHNAGGQPDAPDEKLLEAMQSPKDRIFLLRLEKDVIDFVRDSKMTREEREEAYNRARERIFGNSEKIGEVTQENDNGVSRATMVMDLLWQFPAFLLLIPTQHPYVNCNMPPTANGFTNGNIVSSLNQPRYPGSVHGTVPAGAYGTAAPPVSSSSQSWPAAAFNSPPSQYPLRTHGPSPGPLPGLMPAPTNVPYLYGQLPANANPNDPKSQHPIPGSYNRHAFNPKTQSFVPNSGLSPMQGHAPSYVSSGSHHGSPQIGSPHLAYAPCPTKFQSLRQLRITLNPSVVAIVWHAKVPRTQ
ncbi:unnamed protein product [Parascedosporium putredinis]|uniref:SUZ domain-containing protein n=1 Tax=Parascedosporium putredinis TaxID=1442378 RepID=A0A9P1GZ33_9PEZI|nr:unnamed protein product [Parascedosporium putredinis]CAI7991366.1 unnamed protein product [Parascedosporium putredinis]